jgi:hypothetical protein
MVSVNVPGVVELTATDEAEKDSTESLSNAAELKLVAFSVTVPENPFNAETVNVSGVEVPPLATVIVGDTGAMLKSLTVAAVTSTVVVPTAPAYVPSPR